MESWTMQALWGALMRRIMEINGSDEIVRKHGRLTTGFWRLAMTSGQRILQQKINGAVAARRWTPTAFGTRTQTQNRFKRIEAIFAELWISMANFQKTAKWRFSIGRHLETKISAGIMAFWRKRRLLAWISIEFAYGEKTCWGSIRFGPNLNTEHKWRIRRRIFHEFAYGKMNAEWGFARNLDEFQYSREMSFLNRIGWDFWSEFAYGDFGGRKKRFEWNVQIAEIIADRIWRSIDWNSSIDTYGRSRPRICIFTGKHNLHGISQNLNSDAFFLRRIPHRNWK